MSDLTTFCDVDNNTVGFAVAAYVQTIDPVTCATSYSLVSEYYDTDFVSVGASLPAGWQQCCCESSGTGGPETVTTTTNTVTGNRIATYTNELGVPVDINETITAIGYDPLTNIITYTDEAGVPTDIDLAALAIDINVASVIYDPLTGEITLTETDGNIHVVDIGPVVVPTLCEEMAALPLNTPTPFDRFTDEFVVRNSITGVCKRVNIPTMQLSAVGWQTTRTVGGLQSAQNMVQTPSAYQNFPSTHLQGNFTVPFGGTTGNSNVRLDFNFNLQPSATGATFPAGAWADRYVIDLRVRLDGLAIAHVIRTLASVGEMGNGVPAAFTAYPEYENIHLSVLLGTAVTAGPHTFAVQYSVFTNTVTTGHTRTVQIGWSDWMVESNYV